MQLRFISGNLSSFFSFPIIRIGLTSSFKGMSNQGLKRFYIIRLSEPLEKSIPSFIPCDNDIFKSYTFCLNTESRSKLALRLDRFFMFFNEFSLDNSKKVKKDTVKFL